MDKFIFKWKPDKTSVCLPDGFKSQFDEDSQPEIPLILVDDNDNRESIIYNFEKNSISIKSLVSWQNDFQPKKNEKIALIRDKGYVYRITVLDRDSKQYDGLYLGKIKDDFNKYDLSAD